MATSLRVRQNSRPPRSNNNRPKRSKNTDSPKENGKSIVKAKSCYDTINLKVRPLDGFRVEILTNTRITLIAGVIIGGRIYLKTMEKILPSRSENDLSPMKK